MSRVSFGLGVLALAALALFVAGPTGVAQQPPVGRVGAQPQLPQVGPEPQFAGKLLTVVKKSNPAGSIDLEKVHIQRLEGRSFLVGIGCDTPDNWQKGKSVWVALDDVSEITTFATLEELRKAGTLQEAPKAESPPKRDGLDK
jgi:hypothetical protein